MTPTDWFAGIAAGVAALSALGAVFYGPGKRDGAQAIRNRQTDGLERDMRDVRDRLARVEEGLSRHETECQRRQDEITEHFASQDRRFGEVMAQMGKFASGESGSYREVITGGKRGLR